MGSRPPAARMSMRSKEEAHDYRYFPEPDLPPLLVERGLDRRDRAARCPSCPTRAARRFVAQYALPEYDAGVLTQSPRRSPTTSRPPPRPRATPKASSNWIMGELTRKLNETGAAHRRRAAHARTRSPGLIRLVDVGHDQRADRQGRLREDVRDRPAAPRRSSRPKGWRASTTRRRSTRRSREVLGAQPDAGRAVPRRQAADVRVPRRPGDEGDERQGQSRRSSTRC